MDYRVESDLVPVDVTVTDRKYLPVLDLTPAQFEILEEGIRQSLEFFALEAFAGEEPDALPEVVPPGSPGPARGNAGRTFLIVFGRGRQTQFGSLDKLIGFVSRSLAPLDRVGVIAYNRACDFTTDHAAVVSLLSEYRKVQEEIDAILRLRLRFDSGMPNHLQQRIDAIFSSQTLTSKRIGTPESIRPQDLTTLRLDLERREAREASLGPSELRRGPEIHPGRPDEVALIASEGMPWGVPFQEYFEAQARSGMDVSNLYSAIEYLRFMPGERHLIFFTPEGLFLPRAEDEDSIAAFASDSMVRVHFVHNGGVSLDPFAATYLNEKRSFAQRTLLYVSEDSGGIASLMKDTTEALERIERGTRAVYRLAYRPKIGADGPTYRRIEVRINRKDVRVFHRRGYHFRRPGEPLDLARFRAYARTVSAAQSAEPVSDFAMTLEAKPLQEDREKARIELTVRSYFGPEMVVRQGDRFRGRFSVAWFFFNDSGEFLQDQWKTVHLDLTEDDLEVLMRKGLEFRDVVSLPKKSKGVNVRAVLYDVRNDRIASADLK